MRKKKNKKGKEKKEKRYISNPENRKRVAKQITKIEKEKTIQLDNI